MIVDSSIGEPFSIILEITCVQYTAFFYIVVTPHLSLTGPTLMPLTLLGKKEDLETIVVLPAVLAKPTKWGLKAFVVSDSTTGYAFNWELYTGKLYTPDSQVLHSQCFVVVVVVVV